MLLNFGIRILLKNNYSFVHALILNMSLSYTQMIRFLRLKSRSMNYQTHIHTVSSSHWCSLNFQSFSLSCMSLLSIKCELTHAVENEWWSLVKILLLSHCVNIHWKLKAIMWKSIYGWCVNWNLIEIELKSGNTIFFCGMFIFKLRVPKRQPINLSNRIYKKKLF
jgi:hypothetical protein